MGVQDQLIDKAKEAFVLAIEIYNKPSIKYRIEGFSFFICNAWELMLKAINEQISNFAQTYPTNLKASSNEALLFMRRYRFANCSCFSCCFKDAYPSSNVQ